MYIGRPSKWGNPYSIGAHGTREEVVYLYSQYIHQQPELIEAAKAELKGKDLVCWCSPCSCHGDILVELANGD